MFKCYNCGRIFDRPKGIPESRGEFWGSPCFETMYYCPYCESYEFDEFNGEDVDGEK